jgi:hypothetical protein
MVHFDMMNERWVISSDLIFMNLEDGEGLDRVAYDVLTAGPQLGVAFRF